MQAHAALSSQVCEKGAKLIEASHPQSEVISEHVNALQKEWETLKQLAKLQRTKLDDAAEAAQVT